jgi:branched-chain amino acid transport system substrate-binding protein
MRRYRLTLPLAAAALAPAAAAAVLATPLGGNASAAPGSATAISCTNTRIPVMAPITGPAASIGKEQRNWAKFAIETSSQSKEAKADGRRFTLVESDTQLDPAQASTVGQRLASDSSIPAVVGPAGSQEVEADGPIFKRAGLGYVSPSSTRTDLTAGKYPTFFRVVGRDAAQGAKDATYLTTVLKAKKVVVSDDQTSYGKPLADAAASVLRARGVSVQRESISQKLTDFSALVSTISDDTDWAFLAWQLASQAQTFGQQLKEQGKNTRIFGSDGLFSPDFQIAGSYVSAFAPDIRVFKASRPIAAAYSKKYGKFGTFGPPVYVATQVVMAAVNVACADGRATRSEVLSAMRKTNLKKTILGTDITFDAHGDVKNAKFYIFRFLGGAYKYVRVV